MARQPFLWSSLDLNSRVEGMDSLVEGMGSVVEGMNLVVKGMDQLAVTDLPTQLHGGPRPCPYKVMLGLTATDENNPDIGIWLYRSSWQKVSPYFDLSLPASLLPKSHLLLLLPLPGPTLHNTGSLCLLTPPSSLRAMEGPSIAARRAFSAWHLD